MKRFNTYLILLGAIGFVCASISQYRSSIYPFNKLIPHVGQIEVKSKKKISTNKEALILKLRSNNTLFSITFFNPYFDNSLQIGDSILLYTRNQTNSFFNNITISNLDGTGSSGASSDEILHLVMLNNQEILLDYSKQQELLKKGMWGFPLAAFAFLCWFFWRLSGKSSPLVIERG